MKRQVIQNVLNLPGISGIALIDGRNRPFFFGPEISLNTQQQDALAQGIQQVVSTTPGGFKAFSFRFINQSAYIYKLDQGLILLLLIADEMPLVDYHAAIDQLQATLLEAPHNAVPTFRLLAGCVTLGSGSSGPEPPIPDLPSPALANPDPLVSNRETVGPSQGAPGGQAVLEALNHLSDGAVQYLGKMIVANTWKQARPSHPWLEQFVLDKDGHFSASFDGRTPLTPEQQQWVKDWVTAFLGRGGRTIRNFSTLVSQTLSPQEQALLLERSET